MPGVKSLVRELAKHALSKKGAQQTSSWGNFDPLENPHIDLPGSASWTEFFEVDSDGNDRVARVYVTAERLVQHKKRYPMIQETGWMERDGHIQMAIPLNAGIPAEFIKTLIDEGHALAWSKLDAADRLLMELAGLPYDEPKLLDRLIELHNLKPQRRAIHKIARQAILLRTRKSPEAKIPLGASKIGGRPDLPEKTEWPVYQDGKPLAFLAQINLAEIAKLGSPIRGLPTSGLLSVFSAWGWMEEGDGDPHTPEEGEREQTGWTVVLHVPKQARLKRMPTARAVNSFKAAAVEPTPIVSLPNHSVEPPLAALGWTEDLNDRLSNVLSDFRSLQMGHWLGNSDVLTSHHLLGGYALFQQEFPEEVLEMGLAMFLQIGTDGKTEMGWGDGGELTFYADAKALAKGRFERLWGTCQGG